MLVSIVVPVYNVASYIMPCLESLSQQTYKDIEVIFVDDCGTDNSIDIIRDFVSNHTFPRWQIMRHEHNRGLSAARNTGLKAAQGEYVYFFDSDDEISIDCIERLVAPLKSKQYEVVIGGIKEQYQDGSVSILQFADSQIENPLKSYADGEWYVMAWNKLCNRNFLVSNNLYFEEGLLHEDVVWSFKVACVCKLMYIIDSVTYIYKLRGASIMTSMSVEKDANIYAKAFGIIKRHIDDHNLNYNPDVYRMVEGKKSGILYSLLQINQTKVFDNIYLQFHNIRTANPIKAFFKRSIGFGYLLRDFNYCLPTSIGLIYKKLFYNVFYKIRGKSIEGAVWK